MVLKWPDICCFDDVILGNTSWADEWCLVLKVSADEGAMYELDNSSVFANDGIEHVLVFGFEYFLPALADSTMSISMQDV